MSHKITLLALAISCSLLADNPSHIEARMAYFKPMDNLFCQIYGNAQVSYELEFGHQIAPHYELWTNAALVSREGKTNFLGDSTRYNSYAISGGGKYLLAYKEDAVFYVGLGVSIVHLHLCNNSDYAKRSVYKNSLGGVIKSGMYWSPWDPLCVDLFVDYEYQPIHFEQKRQLGGLKMGVGVGMQF